MKETYTGGRENDGCKLFRLFLTLEILRIEGGGQCGAQDDGGEMLVKHVQFGLQILLALGLGVHLPFQRLGGFFKGVDARWLRAIIIIKQAKPIREFRTRLWNARDSVIQSMFHNLDSFKST